MTTELRITWRRLRSLTLFWMKIVNAATTNLNKHQHCYIVNGVNRSRPQGKTQRIIHSLSATHPLIVSNPIDKKNSEFMRRNMRWEALSMPTTAYDPRLLRQQEMPLVRKKDLVPGPILIPAGGLVRIQDSSLQLVWKERVGETRIVTTEGLTTCLDPGLGWTCAFS